MAPETAQYVAAILNASWMVRHYARGGRNGIQKQERSQAIQILGLEVRRAFDSSEDFEALLTAVVDGLRPKNDPPF